VCEIMYVRAHAHKRMCHVHVVHKLAPELRSCARVCALQKPVWI